MASWSSATAEEIIKDILYYRDNFPPYAPHRVYTREELEGLALLDRLNENLRRAPWTR